MTVAPAAGPHRRRRAGRVAALALASLGAASRAGAQAERCERAEAIPPAVRPFVAPGTCAIAVAQGDVDRDGRGDHVVVLGRSDSAAAGGVGGDAPRALVVLVGTEAGGVRLGARGARAVLCPACGGVMGDPFVAVTARPGAFTVRHAGGAGWRWGADFTFGYSRRDAAWQLVRVDEVSFHAGDPGTTKRRVSLPPRDYGKIDLRDFAADDWRGRGAR
jgi:hypothetical protein